MFAKIFESTTSVFRSFRPANLVLWSAFVLMSLPCQSFIPSPLSSLGSTGRYTKLSAVGPESFETMHRTLQGATGLSPEDTGATFAPFSDISHSSLFESGAPSIWTASSVTLGPNPDLDYSNRKPATGHSDSFWGPPDQYLKVGKSIPPTSLDQSSGAPLKEYSQEAQLAADKGWKLLDATTLNPTGETVLPGFKATGSLLSPSNIPTGGDQALVFKAQLEWASTFIPLYQKLPHIMLWYAVIEFFFLRNQIVLYLEEIPERNTVTETAVTMGVRLAVFTVLSFFVVLF